MQEKPKVFVGVSGGVDSSVALALLQKDYDVTGVFLKVWHPEWLPCDWKEERRSAMRVCATLGVPFLTLNCEDEYKKEVADYMIREYSEGRVPNPDIFCNKYVKFGVFLKKALEMGAGFVATGHYARVEKRDGTYLLLEGVDEDKDQSYFLYTLTQEQLSHTLFPVGHLKKPEVRKYAEKFNLPTATKKDSQGICFLGEIDMQEFLSHYIDKKPGDVLNAEGEVIGLHTGAVFYTIGQRHGFEITKKTPSDPRFFVVSKDISKNTITVAGKDEKHPDMHSTQEIFLNDIHFVSPKENLPLTCEVRIRYRQERQTCEVRKTNAGYSIVFSVPQSGVAVGQSAVLYRDDICLGGGIIEETH